MAAHEGLSFLDDVVILDLGDEATALAGAYLAELGATVVRVEDVAGDVLRRRTPLWHAVHNAGKRSIAIDTSSDAAWALVDAALPGIDVVIGPLEPNAATERFLARLAERGDRHRSRRRRSAATIGTRSAATIGSAWSRSSRAATSRASR